MVSVFVRVMMLVVMLCICMDDVSVGVCGGGDVSTGGWMGVVSGVVWARVWLWVRVHA